MTLSTDVHAMIMMASDQRLCTPTGSTVTWGRRQAVRWHVADWLGVAAAGVEPSRRQMS